MEINDIKKELYKQKPVAVRTSFKGEYTHYVTQLSNNTIVEFRVPNNEAENFKDEEPAQLLIRWIKNQTVQERIKKYG
jgi:hypothetical protein